MKVVIIIPSYNEADHTPEMITSLAEVLPKISDHDVQVLYVDDSSPDGTADIIKKAQKSHKWLHLLVNPKKAGLGNAYAIGMQYAMSQMHADYLMEFDADGQHPPQYIPDLIAEINNGYDYILGSRYIPGGSVPSDWGLDRKLISSLGNLVARATLFMPQVHDCTGGFKLSRVKGFMDEFDFNKLLSRQFAYKVHLLAYMVNKGAKVKEVPFAFAPRNEGNSKMMKNEMQETLRVIFLYQMQNPKILRFLKFGVVGGTGLTIQTLIFEFFGVITNTFTPQVATIIGGEAAIISNFILNNAWTFKDHQVKGVKVVAKFIQFNLSSFVALAIQFVILGIGQKIAAGNKLIIQAFYFGAIIIVLITNYTIYNKFIWKTSTKAVPNSK
jgi:dolichol-phosphate mannosyltransferase